MFISKQIKIEENIFVYFLYELNMKTTVVFVSR